jgi:hypothetical protein
MARNTPSAQQIFSAAASRGGSAQKAVFRKEGEYWTVGYRGDTVRLNKLLAEFQQRKRTPVGW